MDVALFAASVSLSISLPRCVIQSQTTAEQSSMAVAIGLSLGLFSLSVLEAAPSSWLVLLSPDIKVAGGLTAGLLTISRVYWILLWALSLVILVVLPCLAGVAVAETFEHFFQVTTSVDRDDRKYPLFLHWKRICPWWVRFVGGLLRIVFKNCFRLLQRFLLSNNQARQPEPVLVMTVNDEEGSHHDLEMRGLVSPPKHSTFNNKTFLASFGSICGVSSVIVIVSSIGPLVVKTPSDKSALSVIVSWLCAVGLMISSMMNGFGSVSMPYSCLAGLYLKPVGPETISKLESELKSVMDALGKKRSIFRETTVAIKQGTPTNKGFSMTKRFGSFGDIGDELITRKQILQTEIQFLEGLCRDTREDIEELRYSQMMAAKSRTTVGKIKSYVGLIFSVLLLIRLLSAGMSIWRSYTQDTDKHKVPQGDIITTILFFLTGHNILSQKDYTMTSQIVSLGLTMILSVTQVRTFLRTVSAINRRLHRFYEKFYCVTPCSNKKSLDVVDELSMYGGTTGSANVHSELIAGLTGCYFLSCIVLIKMMLPEEFCEGFSTALGGMDVFTIHMSVVNSAFACSAGVSAAILGMLFGIQRQNNVRHTSNSNEKGFTGADAC